MFNWQKGLFYCLPALLIFSIVRVVDFKTDLSAFIIAGDNAEEILLASEMQSGSLSRRYLLSVVSTNKHKVSKNFIGLLQQQLKTIESVSTVWSPEQKTQLTDTIQTLYSHYGGSFYSLTPKNYLDRLFTPQGLQQRAQLLKKMLLSPQGRRVKKIALEDPLLLTIDSFKHVAEQMQQVVNQEQYYQNLLLETTISGLDPQQRSVQTEINRIFNQLKKTQSQAIDYQLEMTGVPIFAVATQTLIQGDIIKVSVLSTVALVFLFLLIFRSFSSLFQVFSLLAIVMLGSILMTQLIFGYVHGMTLAIGSTLVGICIDYPIHAIAHAQAVELDKRRAVIAKIWPSMLLGGLTTMIGYVALGVSGYPGFQQVAVYATTGILISVLLTRFVFPQLITTTQCRQLNIPLVTYWALFCQRFRVYLIIGLSVILVSSWFNFNNLQWMQDMQQLTPELDYLKQNDKRIRERMTSIEPGRFVLITGINSEQALQKSEAVYLILEQLKKQGNLSDYYGIYPWLLSAQHQQYNQAQLQNYLTAENQLRWQQALKQQGLSVKHLGVLNYNSPDRLTLTQVLNTPVKKLIDSRIITTHEQQTIIMIWLAEHHPNAVKTALDQIDHADYFSQRDMLNQMTKNYTEKAKMLLIIGLALIILLLIMRYKSLIKTIQTLLPALLAAFLMLALWSLTGVAISFLHLVGFLLVVAICVDYGIFYQENRGGDISLTYQSMAASMLTSALAFGSLMMAESTALRILASVIAVGVILGFALCPLIIKPLKQ